MREMAAHADGEAFVAMSRGTISHLLMELIGLDVFESIGVAISGDEPIEIRCALAKLEAENGRVKIDPLVMDTSDTKMTGQGEVDLASEKINMLLTPYSKHFSPFTLRSPIRVGGKLADLDVFPDAAKLGPGDTLKQIVSTTLSAIIGLLPPIDMVLADDSPCRDLLTEVRESITEYRRHRPVESLDGGSSISTGALAEVLRSYFDFPAARAGEGTASAPYRPMISRADSRRRRPETGPRISSRARRRARGYSAGFYALFRTCD